MNLPRNPPRDDRRAVPRHIRDGEHDAIEEAIGNLEHEPRLPLGRLLIWSVLVALAAGGLVWWLTRS